MISVSATFKWNDRTKQKLENAPEKTMRQIARDTMDMTGSSKVTAYLTGDTQTSMYDNAVQGDMNSGFYIGNFTDYAMYVYDPHRKVTWTNPNTKPKWFEYIWKKYGKGIIDNACKVNRV